MAYMVSNKEKLVDLAYKLIKAKSSKDDAKAAEDMLVLDTILSGVQTCFNLIELDKRLRREYKTIEMLENILENFCYSDGRTVNKNVTEYERIINNLKSDRAGVIADVLLKHDMIKTVDELYQRVYDN